MMKKLLNSLPGRLLCAAAVLLMVAGICLGLWGARGFWR
jgi:hypothetical protein